MRQVVSIGVGFLLGAALLFALASFGVVGEGVPPAAEGGDGEEPSAVKGEGGRGVPPPPVREDHGEEKDRREGKGDGGHGAGAEAIELATESKRLAAIELAPAERRRLARIATFPGQVTTPAGRLSHVGSRVDGVIHFVKVDLGAVVKEGELLAVLDSIPMGEAKTAYLRARAEHELAEKTVARERELVQTGGSARKELLEAETGLAKAAIELKAAMERLHLLGLIDGQVARVAEEKGEERAHIPILSPLSGVVIERHATPGEFVRPEDKLFMIANLDQVWVIASVPEKDIHEVRTGVTATVKVTAQPHERFAGRLTYIAPQVDAKTRMIQVRIEVPNEERLLKTEMFAEVAIPLTEGVDGVAVPVSAVQRVAGKSAVFVSGDGKRFERRPVEVGVESDGWVEVRRGVEAGEPVVVKGAFLVKSEFEREAIGEGHAD